MKCKLGALLLLAPLLAMAPVRADLEIDPVSGHINTGESAGELVDLLKSMGTIGSKDGDVYVFKKDGRFEYRRGKKSAKGMTYLNDYGRFTVKPKADTDGRPGGADTTLVLKITSSKKRAGGQIVKHTDTHSRCSRDD